MAIRVMHIITRMILGGAQENTLLTCEGLNRSPDWDITLVTGPALGPEGELLERTHKSGIKTVILPHLRREPSPVNDTLAFSQILSQIKSLRPHIVHTHSSKAGILGRVAAHMARVPAIVHTIHGLPFHCYQSRFENTLYIMMERFAALCTDSIICVAEAMRAQALTAGVGRPHQYSVIYSGMEVEPYISAGSENIYLRREFGFDENDIIVAKIARLFDLKGHTYVLDAAVKVIEENPRVKFLFVGDGILRHELERKAMDLGIDEHVFFSGLLPPSMIPEVVACSDILVHASFREGLPRVAVQSLLGAKPVVCFKVDGAPEVVIDGITGSLVPPGSTEGLAKAITYLANNPSIARQMGIKGQKRCIERFRAEKMVNDIAHLYKSLDFFHKKA